MATNQTNEAGLCSQATSSYEPLTVGKTYAEIEDDGRLGVLYRCVDSYEEEQYGPRVFVMVDEDSPDSDPRYISGPSATTEFWVAQL